MDLKEYIFLKIDNSGLSFRHLKCGAWVFRKPNNGCTCTSGEVAISLLKVVISLLQGKRIPGYNMASSFRSQISCNFFNLVFSIKKHYFLISGVFVFALHYDGSFFPL